MKTIAIRVFCNGLWLLVPVMVWNVALAGKLPHAYSMEVFSKAIPSTIAVPENVLRIALFALPSVTVLSAYSTHRQGYIVFVLGLAIYFASWLILIYGPQSRWGHSAVGFLAPAYTPLLWLIGIALVTRSYIGGERLIRWAFLVLATAFLTFHISHAAFVYSREYRKVPNRSLEPMAISEGDTTS